MSEKHTEIETEALGPREQFETYSSEKEKLLLLYKSLAPELEYAIDDVERGHIESQREKLAQRIKSLGSKMRDLETSEHLA